MKWVIVWHYKMHFLYFTSILSHIISAFFALDSPTIPLLWLFFDVAKCNTVMNFNFFTTNCSKKSTHVFKIHVYSCNFLAIFPPKFVKKPIVVVTDAETHGWSQIKWVFINSPITRFLCDKTLSQKMIALEPVTLLEASKVYMLHVFGQLRSLFVLKFSGIWLIPYSLTILLYGFWIITS